MGALGVPARQQSLLMFRHDLHNGLNIDIDTPLQERVIAGYGAPHSRDAPVILSQQLTINGIRAFGGAYQDHRLTSRVGLLKFDPVVREHLKVLCPGGAHPLFAADFGAIGVDENVTVQAPLPLEQREGRLTSAVSPHGVGEKLKGVSTLYDTGAGHGE